MKTNTLTKILSEVMNGPATHQHIGLPVEVLSVIATGHPERMMTFTQSLTPDLLSRLGRRSMRR